MFWHFQWIVFTSCFRNLHFIGADQSMPITYYFSLANVFSQNNHKNKKINGIKLTPLISKNHHSIICFRTNDSSNTLCRLPLCRKISPSTKRSSKVHIKFYLTQTIETSRYTMLIGLIRQALGNHTKASKVKKSPSFIWNVSRKYSNLASNILQHENVNTKPHKAVM